MSDKKESAQTTEYNLRKAEGWINEAERSATNTGDKSLVQKVTKLREGVREVREDLSKKLDNHQS